ncbi:hypothetical protein JW859_05365 [bacterium]|nr:hypothetical protein [bacterium]
MSRWTPIAVIALVVVFIGAVVYLSYVTAQTYLRWRAVNQFKDEIYFENEYPPTPDRINELKAQVDEKQASYGGNELEMLQVDLLVHRSFYFPETGAEDLRQAIEKGQRIYREEEWSNTYLAQLLSYCYYGAELPAKLDRWQAEAIAKNPSSRYYVRWLQVAARVASDDLDGARALIEQETTQNQRHGVEAFAVCSYLLLQDLDAAQPYADKLDRGFSIDDDIFKRNYAWYLVAQDNDFESAKGLFGEVFESIPPSDPNDALSVAIVWAGADGFDDPLVQDLMRQATESTRVKLSLAAAQAWVAAELYSVLGVDNYVQRILELEKAHPEDCQVALALLYSVLLAPDADSAARLKDILPQTTLEYARRALELAATDQERQAANIYMAIALCQPAADGSLPDQASLDQAVIHLRRALGDPDVEDSVISQRTPDYEEFLLSPQVQAARADNPDFDAAVHRSVIDYLNRRQELFSEVVKLPKLEY